MSTPRDPGAADPYRDDLAYIHDAGHGDVARAAARALLDELRAAGHARGTIVDLGCGSGILAAAVSAAGFDVVGHDVSEAMVALARRRAPRATFHVGSFVSAALPPSVAVSAVGEVLNYVFDPANDEAARHRFFARVHEALVPGGVLLFDVAGPDRVPPGGTARSGATGEDWAVVAETRREPGAELVTRTITTFRLVDGAYRRDAEVHPFVLIDPPALADQLRAIGFAVRTVPGYGPASLPPGVVSLVARKAARTPGG